MKASEFRRCYHSQERVDFVRLLPCAACGGGPCENHHIESGGTGRKADYDKIIPLCLACHRGWHSGGKTTHQRKWKYNAAEVAELTEELWRAKSSSTRTRRLTQ